MAGITIWNLTHKKKRVTERAMLFLMAAFLAIAPFNPWREEHAKSVNYRPNLVASIDSFVVGEVHDTNAPNLVQSGVFFLVTIRNLGGMPSIVQHFNMSVHSKTLTLPSLERYTILENMPLVMGNGDTILLHATNAIYEVGTSAIQSGNMKSGWIHFRANGVSKDILNEAGTLYTLSFEDVFGTNVVATYVCDGKRGDPILYHPGAGSEIKTSTTH